MKTAEEWMRDKDPRWGDCFDAPELTPETIKQIQLDAFKAGMTKAAVLCESTGDNVSRNPELTDAEANYQDGAYTCQRIIQQSRDSLTELPKDGEKEASE